MKILHTISGLGVKCGGTASCTYDLIKGIRSCNVDADVLTFAPEENDHLIGNDSFIKIVQRPKHIISNTFKEKLVNSNYQIFHINGIWEYVEYIASKIARKRNISYLISPHGMLYPQALRKSAWKKKLALTMYLMSDLTQAATIHATCEEEMNHLRTLGIRSPVAVIPNPVHITTESTILDTKDKLRVGYLGRIHPRKNIERLIRAWEQLGEKVNDCELVIIGDGDEAYHQLLKTETNRLNLKNVIFTGFLSGVEKDNAIESLSYLVVPSDFENFGMIVPEVLIKGIPVIASKGTPWEELNTHHCGWWVDNDVDTLTVTIETAINTPENERRVMGQNGQKLVIENYSVEVVAKKMIRLYKWILNGGEKPEFVFL